MAIAAAAWLLLDGGSDDAGSSEELVDAGALVSCLKSAPSPSANWRVIATPALGPTTGTGPSSAAMRMRTYGELTVYPNEVAAEELRSRVTFEGQNYAGDPPDAERRANVLITDYEDELAMAGDDVVEGCLEEAARAKPAPTEPGFTDCGDTRRVERLSVRGVSCEVATRLLAEEPLVNQCRPNGGEFLCLSEYLCCMLSARYMGNGDVELVFNF